MSPGQANSKQELPDCYTYVARDVVKICSPSDGVWMDLGCGEGPMALALAQMSGSVFVLVDPNREALSRAKGKSQELGLSGRTLAAVGRAENLPFADNSIDLVVSRGSIFFWENRPAGVREVHRVLRPGGKAMIGGGLGSTYPEWARRRFIQRRCEGVRKRGPKAVRRFREARRPETFRRWARDAGLKDFRVVGEGGLPVSDADTGLGIWLVFQKEID